MMVSQRKMQRGGATTLSRFPSTTEFKCVSTFRGPAHHLHARTKRIPRHGLSIVEVVVCIVVAGLLVAICVPAILYGTQSARANQCRYNLLQIGRGLDNYHTAHGKFPAAAVWKRGPLSSVALHLAKRIDLVTYDNWALLLLPHVNQADLANQWKSELQIANEANAAIRTKRLSIFTCPSDTYNRADNPYQMKLKRTEMASIEFSRGNYGINGGSHNGTSTIGSTSAPAGDRPTLVLDENRGEFRYLGSGVAGINWPLSRNEFANGQSTMIMVDELRSGIDPIDPRGVWALGQIGGSITWAHGINGDAFAPNNQWPRSDDILGCKDLHQRLGTSVLMAARMPCVDYVDVNHQAAARSEHPGGVHVLFADGQTRLISDGVDPGLWHVLHSRETDNSIYTADLNTLLARTNDLTDAPPSRSTHSLEGAARSLENSIGMEFVLIPAGEFTMGLPDFEIGTAPPESPAHQVKITSPFYLGRYEVTQRQFAAVLHRNPSHHTPDNNGMTQTDDFPVEQVTWEDARLFCDELSSWGAEVAAGRRYRLPTEAEWEYACRGAVSIPHKLPHSIIESEMTGETAGVYPGLALGSIGRFPANPFGLYDMRGNVWEWCQDWFDRDYYQRSPMQDPQGPATGYLKVVRGSDWIFVGEKCLINYPIMPPTKTSPFVGFRVACEHK